MSSLVDDIGGFFNRHHNHKDRMAREIANAVKAHADMSFRRGGFTGSGLRKWRRLKRATGRPVLHGVSRPQMRGSTKVISANWPNIVVQNLKPYADFHQDGAPDRGMPARPFMAKEYGVPASAGGSPVLDRKVDSIVRRHAKQAAYGY